MQDKYTGDVGDYGKYGLLNEICRQSDFNVRLGVNWYYTKDDKTGDGGDIKYLEDNQKFRICFPELYDKLKDIVYNDRRKIEEIENNLILPENTVFYSKRLPVPSNRKTWFAESWNELKKADIIFLDPDNGIKPGSIKKTWNKSIKYAFIDEIEEYYKKGKSLIIYNNRDRKPKSEYDGKIIDIIDYLNISDRIKVLKFKRFTIRHYIFLIQERHQYIINKTIEALNKEPYIFLYETYDLPIKHNQNRMMMDNLHKTFQNCIEIPIPSTLIPETKLDPIFNKPLLFCSSVASALDEKYLLQGDVDDFIKSCPMGYFLIGFWGHGVNSYGFYYSRVDSWSKIFFRLAYGGHYMDNKKMARFMREFLTQFIKFDEKMSKIAKTLVAIESMDYGYYKVVMPNGQTHEISESIYKDANVFDKLINLCEK